MDRLAPRGNVAQFVAFRPDSGDSPRQSFARIAGHEPNELFLDPHEAIDALLVSSGEGKVNTRGYLPDEPRSRELVYGLTPRRIHPYHHPQWLSWHASRWKSA